MSLSKLTIGATMANGKAYNIVSNLQIVIGYKRYSNKINQYKT